MKISRLAHSKEVLVQYKNYMKINYVNSFANKITCFHIIWVLSLVFLTACQSLVKDDYYYNGIIVRNNTDESLFEVKIKVEETHAVFMCGNIPPRAMCSNEFPKRKYLGHPVQITLTYNNVKRTTDTFILKVPQGFDTAMPLMGVLEVNKGGIINPYFEQRKY